MRPIRLELEGFTAYREYTVLDFEGADLFVLTGPTGSGKSSIIDAITFALYGSVARYQNPNLVHPVISQGKLEARVRFDFAVEGREYTALRIVRKTPRGGATTKEARLESRDRVLAGSADEVSGKVRELLGLNFDQFTTCVVLPQGEFARFLHEKPAERQDLLTKLLGVDIYEKMGSLARLREAEAQQGAKLLEDELDRLREATPEAKKKAAARVKELTKLKKDVEATEPELEKLDKEREALTATAERLEREAALLAKVSIPAGVDKLDDELERARGAREAARKARSEADEAVARLEEARAALPESHVVHELDRAHRDRASKAMELEARRAETVRAREKVSRAEEAVEEATKRLRAAREDLEATRRELAAHDLAAHLKRGEPCPVCRRNVDRVPALTLPPALSNAEDAVARAEKASEGSSHALREAAKAETLARERLEAVERAASELEKKLEKAPGPEELATAKRLDDELGDARRLQADRRRAEEAAEKAIERLEERERDAFRAFDEARDRVAALAPPATSRTGLAEVWARLHEWARLKGATCGDEAEKARSRVRDVERARGEKLEALEERARALGVSPDGARLRDAVVSALATSESELSRVDEALARAKDVRSRIEAEREASAVAGALGQHLRATGFERWLLGEAFRRLAEGATAILNDLSSGQYSFEYDDRLNFEVVDHRNADERRSARTLSGGETFLASLALALTLAEQTAELAAEGAARLESLFLDEGFGTLDDDTLEVVAAAIEELGAKGRVVGLVTHQQSLAEKIPVQFRVSKGPVTATVERVVV